jgi:TonB family protein
MMRDANTPLVLWICAAICAHYMFAEGGDTVARAHEDRLAIASLGEHVRERVRFSEQTFEVSSIDAPKPSEEQPPAPPPEPPPAPKPTATPVPTVKPPPPPVAQKPPPPPVVKPAPKIAVQVVPEDPAKKLLEPPPQTDRRIAVRQHVKPSQADNPNARFVGDEANHVDKETVATQTSHDQDDANPTPGGNHAGSSTNVGDSERTKIAESEEHAGEKNRGPGERGTEFEIQRDPMPTRPQGAVATKGPTSSEAARSGGDGKQAATSTNPPPDTSLPGGPGPASPDIQQGSDGSSWTFNPIRPGAGSGSSSEAGPGSGNKTPMQPGTTKWLGLGGRVGPGQINLNLNQTGVLASVGMDQLRKEREADGERRKSEHRGSWSASNFERWRSAIENYVSSVKPGNQTALNTAAVPFATYLNGMHNRIHPIFADSFLSSLSSLPRENPLNDPKLITRLELVVTRDGHLVKMGIVKTSGVTAFDIAALDSVQRASPFGPAPTAIISPDGNVYLHWEFHRDEVYACSTMNARPFMLNVAPKAPPVDPNPAPNVPGPASPTKEQGAPPPVNTNETREGALPPPARDLVST